MGRKLSVTLRNEHEFVPPRRCRVPTWFLTTRALGEKSRLRERTIRDDDQRRPVDAASTTTSKFIVNPQPHDGAHGELRDLCGGERRTV